MLDSILNPSSNSIIKYLIIFLILFIAYDSYYNIEHFVSTRNQNQEEPS